MEPRCTTGSSAGLCRHLTQVSALVRLLRSGMRYSAWYHSASSRYGRIRLLSLTPYGRQPGAGAVGSREQTHRAVYAVYSDAMAETNFRAYRALSMSAASRAVPSDSHILAELVYWAVRGLVPKGLEFADHENFADR